MYRISPWILSFILVLILVILPVTGIQLYASNMKHTMNSQSLTARHYHRYNNYYGNYWHGSYNYYPYSYYYSDPYYYDYYYDPSYYYYDPYYNYYPSGGIYFNFGFP